MPEAYGENVELLADHRPPVVLVHGIYMGAWAMLYLAHGLRRLGWTCRRFGYASVRRSPVENSERLALYLRALEAPGVHLVAHSLGGLLVRHLVHQDPAPRLGRVVTLGTPHQGSYAGRFLYRHRLLRPLLGRSIERGVLGDLPPWPPDHPLGNIAGTRRLGLGQLVPGLPVPNDGTVALEETRLGCARDHLELPLTHTALLLCPVVVRQVDRFLRHGRFDRPAEPRA